MINDNQYPSYRCSLCKHRENGHDITLSPDGDLISTLIYHSMAKEINTKLMVSQLPLHLRNVKGLYKRWIIVGVILKTSKRKKGV